MKLVTFLSGDAGPRPGLVVASGIVDLSAEGFRDAIAFLSSPASVQSDVSRSMTSIPMDDAKLLAPIPKPPRIFCIGVNYAEHAKESGTPMKNVPTVFMKLSSSVIGPEEKIILPRASSMPDFEAELAVVIGTPGYQIPAEKAMDHVFGYTVMNDVSARDVQKATSQFTLGKSFPTFAPMGPWIVSKDEVPDPHALGISLTIDGEKLQDSTTGQMIFKIPELIAYISGITPLEAGDVISTGTPEGVGMGRTPPRWLKPQEEVVIRVERVGELRNFTCAE